LSWAALVSAAEISTPPATGTSAPAATEASTPPATDTSGSAALETAASAKEKKTESSDSNESSGASLIAPDTELIDIPTAALADYGALSTRTRFFSNGGVLEWLSFGVHQRFNIGASLNVDKFIGSTSPVQVTKPDLQVKFRLYDGTAVLPALAVGFDNQGYLYNRVDHLYNQRDRGVYIVGSQEVIIPGFQIHGGINIPDFNDNPLFGFMAADYNIKDRVLLMTEWDNINNFVDSRVNMGIRAYITPTVSVDFAARGVGQGGHYDDGTSRGPERVVMFKYTGNF